MRETILQAIINGLQPLDFVLALWQGGSAAHGYTDEWSDLDIEVIVEDNYVQQTLDHLDQSLEKLSPIRFKWRVPEPTWHGHSQCFYHLAETDPFLFVDFVVMQRSNPNRFLEVERHGKPVIGFDKANLMVPATLDRREHLAKMQERLATLKSTFDFFQILIQKEINRGHLVAAISNYHSFTLKPLVELLGMVYRPERYDFSTKYFNRDFPADVIARVSPLYCVSDLADLTAKQQAAVLMFAETLKIAQESNLF